MNNEANIDSEEEISDEESDHLSSSTYHIYSNFHKSSKNIYENQSEAKRLPQRRHRRNRRWILGITVVMLVLAILALVLVLVFLVAVKKEKGTFQRFNFSGIPNFGIL